MNGVGRTRGSVTAKSLGFQESLGPFGPEVFRECPSGCLWGPSGPALRSVQKVSRECPQSIKKVSRTLRGHSRDTSCWENLGKRRQNFKRKQFRAVLANVRSFCFLYYQGRAGIISVVQWNLRPVVCGVDCAGSGLPQGPFRENNLFPAEMGPKVGFWV